MTNRMNVHQSGTTDEDYQSLVKGDFLGNSRILEARCDVRRSGVPDND